ncbi:MAG: NAD-dependent epimerase/dehydratase family protein, partial [Treponema sp.]|nr:NAD-dependent epimerase/dehydratase family protein [Treponema sp.]
MKTVNLNGKTILVTGAAGFIGSYLCKKLLDSIKDVSVIGLDCITDYYDVSLKQERLSMLSSYGKKFVFVKADISDAVAVQEIFKKHSPSVVVNLAAQAGVRYSITNPDAYIKSNIIGFYNIIEACRHNPVEHLVFASSSSVYGSNK